MSEYHNNKKQRIFSNLGAATGRAVTTIAAAALSVCAALFTFWVMTEIETRWANRSNNRAAAAAARGAAHESENLAASMTEEQTPSIPESNRSDTNGYSYSQDGAANEPLQPPSSTGNRRSTPPPASSYQPPTGPDIPFIIENAPPHTHLFALTFDGGSSANAANDILDTLASRNVKSTMFVTGEFIRKHPNTVTRIVTEGHELGNHTHRHPHLTSYSEDRTHRTLPNVTREFIFKELNGAAQILADKTGLRFAPLWRAPYGEQNRQICKWALEAGYVHIGWRQGRSWWHNLDTNDWVPDENHASYRSPEDVITKITNIAAQPGGLNGGIILMHLGTERKLRGQQVHTALGRMIDTLRGMGYEPVRVSDMLYSTGIDINVLVN